MLIGPCLQVSIIPMQQQIRHSAQDCLDQILFELQRLTSGSTPNRRVRASRTLGARVVSLRLLPGSAVLHTARGIAAGLIGKAAWSALGIDTSRADSARTIGATTACCILLTRQAGLDTFRTIGRRRA